VSKHRDLKGLKTKIYKTAPLIIIVFRSYLKITLYMKQIKYVKCMVELQYFVFKLLEYPN